MKDVAPALLEKIEKAFNKAYTENTKIQKILLKINDKSATYKEASEFAGEVGDLLALVFKENLSSDVLPDGKMYYNIAQKVIKGPLENNHTLIAAVCKNVQESLNKKAGIGLTSISPTINTDKVNGLIDIVSSAEHFDDVKNYLDEPVVNFTMSIVDDAIKENAEVQYKAGLSPKIKRTAEAKCCKWCDRLAGTYNYEDVRNPGNDVFRRHRYCRCLTEYVADGIKTNVHTKKDTSKESRIQQIKDLEELDNKKRKDKKKPIKKPDLRKSRIEEVKRLELEDKQKREVKVKAAKENSEKKEPKLQDMPLDQLRKEAEKVAIQYYKSGKSGISFGNASVEHVAKTLAQQGSRTSLIKDIRSMKSALK